MPHDKDTTFFQTTNSLFQAHSTPFARISPYLKHFFASEDFKSFKKLKTKGYGFQELFTYLFFSPFISLLDGYVQHKSGIPNIKSPKKDAFYTFLRTSAIQWRELTYQFAQSMLMLITPSKQDTSHTNYFIFDDTLIEKTGKTIEGVSWVFDHTSNTYKLGFKMLVLSIFDGKRFIPLDFSLHSEQNNKKSQKIEITILNRITKFFKNRNEKSEGKIRLDELESKKTDNILKMFGRAWGKGYRARFALFDSWFAFPSLIAEILRITNGMVKVIAMAKNGNINYTYEGKVKKINGLIQENIRKKRYSKALKVHYIRFVVSHDQLELVLWAIQNRQQNKWQVLVCTDLTMDFQQAVKHYQMRWAIEVFFKDIKQNLHLGKSQARDFDEIIASISITLMQYMSLVALLYFEDQSTIGGLFRMLKKETNIEQILDKAFNFIIEIYNSIENMLNLNSIDFISVFIKNRETLKRVLSTL